MARRKVKGVKRLVAERLGASVAEVGAGVHAQVGNGIADRKKGSREHREKQKKIAQASKIKKLRILNLVIPHPDMVHVMIKKQ